MPSPVVVYSDDYHMDLGLHVFPATKFRLVAERLIELGITSRDEFVEPEPVDTSDVIGVHDAGYVDRILNGSLSAPEILTLELPFNPDLVRAFWLATGGTLKACEAALSSNIGINLTGGFHHAFAGHGEGFCLINDVAIAVDALRSRGAIERALVVDLDVHHGNGTASIFADNADVFTMSLHQENNYPIVKPASDLDLGFEDRVTDEIYLEALEKHLPSTVELHQPDLVVYLAGADPYEADRLGGLALSIEGLGRRDEIVFRSASSQGVPVCAVLAGGYALDTRDTVEIHVNMVRAAMHEGAVWPEANSQ